MFVLLLTLTIFLLLVGGLVGFIVGVIMLTINLIKKRDKKRSIWITSISIVLFFAGFLIIRFVDPETYSSSETTTTSSSKISTVAEESSSDKDTPAEESSSDKDTPTEEYHVGDTASADGYDIKVNSVNYNAGTEFDTPDTGKQYVIINVTITNNTGEKQSYNPFDFKLNANGNATDVGEIVSGVKDELHSGELDNGASVTGNLVGQADPNAKLKLQYKSSIWDDETVDISLN